MNLIKLFVLLTASFAPCRNHTNNPPRTEVADWTDPKATRCPVHYKPLFKVEVLVFWGLPAESARDHPDMRRNERFPYSGDRVFGGCCIPENPERRALIHRCEDCVRLAAEWKAEHMPAAPKHLRPIAPKDQTGLARIVAKGLKPENPLSSP